MIVRVRLEQNSVEIAASRAIAWRSTSSLIADNNATASGAKRTHSKALDVGFKTSAAPMNPEATAEHYSQVIRSPSQIGASKQTNNGFVKKIMVAMDSGS